MQNLFDLIPDDVPPDIPLVIDELRRSLTTLERYRICPDHPKRTAEEYAISAVNLSMAVQRIRDAINDLSSLQDPVDAKVTEARREAEAAEKSRIAAEAKAAKAARANADLKSELSLASQRAEHFEGVCQQLQDRNLERADVATIVQRTLVVMAGMRWVQWLADPGDCNRQVVCGILLQLQRLLHDCGAEVEIAMRPESCQTILTEYYATLRPRDLESLRVRGQFYERLPERMTA